MKRRYLLQSLGITLGGGIWLYPSFAQTDSLPSVPDQVPDPLSPVDTPTTPNPDVEFSRPDAPAEATPEPILDPEIPPGGLGLTWLHHSCVAFEADGFKILVNPFRSIGCTQGYPEPAVEADLVLLSSRLFDEGYIPVVPGNPRVLFQPGDYKVEEIRIQGVRMAHDNITANSDRFGINIGWRWTQANIDIVHLGGAAAPITREQSILLAKPDILLVPVGGGPKNYDPAGAKAAIEVLQPRLIIPTMYRTEAADSACELVEVSDFLSLFPIPSIQFAPGTTLILTSENLPQRDAPQVLSFGS